MKVNIKGIDTEIDEEDLPLIHQYNWHVERQANGCIYFMYHVRLAPNKSRTIKLHRLIAGATSVEGSSVFNIPSLVDHIDRNTLNNSRSNLRLCSRIENARNSRIPKSNSSGHKGVSWSKSKNKWRAYIMIDYKQKFLGYFSDLDEAVAARVVEARKTFGEFFAEGVE